MKKLKNIILNKRTSKKLPPPTPSPLTGKPIGGTTTDPETTRRQLFEEARQRSAGQRQDSAYARGQDDIPSIARFPAP